MKIHAGIIMAPRPEATVMRCFRSMQLAGFEPQIFAEPESTKLFATKRPDAIAPVGGGIVPSPSGVFGNFQNWIQASRDLLVDADPSDAILIAEDDALFAQEIAPVLERDLWPSTSCGCVSLYCPNMSNYKQITSGLNLTQIETPERLTSRGNLVGALGLIFPATVLRELVYHPSVTLWRGSHKQSENPNTKPWERKAVDTWIGRTLAQMGHSLWHYSPSLVLHHEPAGSKSNSSMGHGPAKRMRQARSFVGEKPRDLLRLLKQRTSRYDIPANSDQNNEPVSGS
jgi:hypothetical protein